MDAKPLLVPRPLSERIVEALPFPAVATTLGWGVFGPARPLIAGGVLLLMGEREAADEVIGRNVPIQWVLGYLAILATYGSRRLRADLSGILAASSDDETRERAARLASPVGWIVPPVVIALLFTIVGAVGRGAQFPPAVVAVDALVVFLISIPIATWLWTYAVALSRLDPIALRGRPAPSRLAGSSPSLQATCRS